MEELHVVGVERIGHDEQAGGVGVGQVVVEGVRGIEVAALGQQPPRPGAFGAAAEEAARHRAGGRSDGRTCAVEVGGFGLGAIVVGMGAPEPAVAGGLVAIAGKRGQHGGRALRGAAAGKKRRPDVVSAERSRHPPGARSRAIGEDLGLARVGPVVGDDRHDLTYPLVRRIAVNHLLFGPFLDIDHHGNRKPRAVRPAEVGPGAPVSDEVAYHAHSSAAKPEGQGRGVQSGRPSPVRQARAISARVANQTPSWPSA